MTQLRPFLLVLALFITTGFITTGCGGGGGTEGDEQDPAVTGDDEEQMTDETDEALNPEGGATNE